MNNRPVTFQVDIERIRETLRHTFLQDQEHYQEMILSEIEATLTLPLIQQAIRGEVRRLVDNAIKEVGKNYQIQVAITDSIDKAVLDTLRGK